MLMSVVAMSQSFGISGRVVDAESGDGVGFSYVMIPELSLWAIADDGGFFVLRNVAAGECLLQVNCMGYEKFSTKVNVASDIDNLVLRINASSLKINDVVVVAQRKKSSLSTSYSIDRMALENQQILNMGSVSSLLPGGKTINDNLTDDNRLSLRSEKQEMGNASFGTAIEVDGVRMDNNAMMGEVSSASTRSVATSDIESVDIVTGIPSVEYGDLSNGVVKINLHRGKSPYIVEAKINQSTSQYSLNKGFDMGNGRGVVNMSFEHARSLKEIASPYTSYKRNVLSLRYSNLFFRSSMPLNVTLGVSGNIGGYMSEQDPDRNLDSYEKEDERLLRVNFDGSLLVNKAWLTDLSFKANMSLLGRLKDKYTNVSSSSSQPYIHAMQTGYHVAGTSPDNDIVLGPIGYWYVHEYNDQKPVNANFALKANRSKRVGHDMTTKLMLGADLSMSGNNGRGRYYNDMSVAPTWREYRYDALPWMYNMAFYAEAQMTRTLGKNDKLTLNAGVRDDMTMIPESAYNTVGSLSPRFSGRYVWTNDNDDAVIEDVAIHAGWGRSVKLPSFQVLYPQESYSDLLSFTPGTTADNKAYYAYYTYVSKPIYNDALKFQMTRQTDVGIEMTVKGVKLSVSGFYTITANPYCLTRIYTPLQYAYTSQAALEGIGIASADRTYCVDPSTGIVTVSGNGMEVALPSTLRNTYLKNPKYVNSSDVKRYGLEWMIDVEIRKWLTMRLDGMYYRYRGIDETLIAGTPSGIGDNEASSAQQPLIGYYRGSNNFSASTESLPTIGNGSESAQCRQNASLTLRVPKARLIMTLKAETSLLNMTHQLSEAHGGKRGLIIDNAGDIEGRPYNGEEDHYVILYPEYYSTWENPNEKICFAEALANAKISNQALYQQLSRLIVRSSTSYSFNKNKVSAYCSMNFLVTKEIGDHVSLSFYANNFVNTMKSVRESQTHLETSLFDSKYVPKLYYGLSLKLKI